jgi:FAD/FMN-containing dehydrogenase
MGWLARKHGLQANSVTAVELVTADGRLVRADHATEPDLFWALRGGGGNFGVITALEFAVYPVEQLYAGVMLFEFERAAEVLHTWNESLPAMPDELTSWASLLHVPDLPFAPEPLRGRSFAVVLAAFLGDEAYGRALLANIRDLGPVLDTFAATSPAALAEMAMDPRDPWPRPTGVRSSSWFSYATPMAHSGGRTRIPAPNPSSRARWRRSRSGSSRTARRRRP